MTKAPIWLGIDGTNWIHTLYSACGGDAVGVAALRLQALVRFVQPAVMLVAFDRRSFRYELDAGYKAGRKAKDAALIAALADAEAALAEHAAIVFADGFEADDCLATLARCGTASGVKVVLASPDKDLRQCLAPERVTMLCTFRVQNGHCLPQQWFTSEALRVRYGLTPQQWPDYQALVGDAGDAIAGCTGWGEVTATKVLQKCGTLDACLADPWICPVTARQRDALRMFSKRAALVRQLVTLRTDVDAVTDALR